ncbi:MAG: hypothetical protein N2491_04660 [Negativicutes bacterium]|nr:hypothetical protein [Negativicutes bacterium]
MMIKPAKELWHDYLFLTQEMAKFLQRQDFDMFFELMEQRERLQAMIDEADGDGFKVSDEGRQILNSIRQENQLIMLQLRVNLNNARHERKVNQAYDPYAAMGLVGSRMDRQS